MSWPTITIHPDTRELTIAGTTTHIPDNIDSPTDWAINHVRAHWASRLNRDLTATITTDTSHTDITIHADETQGVTRQRTRKRRKPRKATDTKSTESTSDTDDVESTQPPLNEDDAGREAGTTTQKTHEIEWLTTPPDTEPDEPTATHIPDSPESESISPSHLNSVILTPLTDKEKQDDPAEDEDPDASDQSRDKTPDPDELNTLTDEQPLNSPEQAPIIWSTEPPSPLARDTEPTETPLAMSDVELMSPTYDTEHASDMDSMESTTESIPSEETESRRSRIAWLIPTLGLLIALAVSIALTASNSIEDAASSPTPTPKTPSYMPSRTPTPSPTVEPSPSESASELEPQSEPASKSQPNPAPAPQPQQPPPAPPVASPTILGFACTRSGTTITTSVIYTTGGSPGTLTITAHGYPQTMSIPAAAKSGNAEFHQMPEHPVTCTATIATNAGTDSAHTTTN